MSENDELESPDFEIDFDAKGLSSEEPWFAVRYAHLNDKTGDELDIELVDAVRAFRYANKIEDLSRVLETAAQIYVRKQA